MKKLKINLKKALKIVHFLGTKELLFVKRDYLGKGCDQGGFGDY